MNIKELQVLLQNKVKENAYEDEGKHNEINNV